MSSIAPAKRALQPDAGGESRAARARAERMAVVPAGRGIYDVITEADNVYTVTLPAGRCTCPDNRYRDARCKHVRRVAMEITEGTVPAPDERDAVCAACDEIVFVEEDTDDPVYCADCTLRTGETVVDRENDRLLVVVATTAERADEYRITDRGWTVADHPTNADYDAHDQVVEVLYPLERGVEPAEISPADLKRYAFPRGRLERRS